MDYSEFKKAISLSVRLFVQHERSLFAAYGDDLREEAISHQLANKIGCVFKDFDVDCEYSRQLDGNQKQNDFREDKRPDIIVHKRGTNENNLALIEVKWDKNRRDDTEKVTTFKKLCYAFGVVVRFDGNGNVVTLKVYDYQSSTWDMSIVVEA
jgi:hypothetical protein